MAVFEIKGVAGQVMLVYDDRVELTQTGVMGFISRGLAGTKTYHYSDITTIQFKNCGWFHGFIEFTFAGGLDSRGDALHGINNDNRFTFGRPTIGAARKLALEMEKVHACLLEKLKKAKTSRIALTQVVAQSSQADEILKFKNLLDRGIITQEEFEVKKRNLLGL